MANALTKIKSGAIGADAIDSSDFAAASIDNEHLADNAVGLAEMASGTDGQIITYDASGDPVAVGPGTDGQVLTSTGAGSPPAFETPAAGVGGATGVDFNDGVKARWGTGNDFEAYYDGSLNISYLNHTNGSGSLILRGDDLKIQSNTGTENYITAGHNGAVNLYHDNTKQCETSANGLAFPSGKGIDFSATSGSGTSELFDDYEEGTMTLGLTGTTGAPSAGVQNSAVGYYTKIGNSVHCTVYFNGVNMSGVTGTIELTGLPFTVSNTGHHHIIPVEMVYNVNWSSGDKHVFYTTSNGTTAHGIKSIANAAWQNWSSGDWAASITYYTDFYFRTDS